MKIQITSEPRRGSARSRTDDGLRGERRLADQIRSDVDASTPGVAFRLRQARDQSDSQLAEEREESDRDLLRERSARYAAVAALADREELLAVFGHDMKSLLSVLSVHAELAAGQSQGGPGGLENVQRAVRQMDRLISNLLDLARLRAGKFHVVADKSNAAEIVEEAVDVFRPLASVRSLSLEAELPGKDLPPFESTRLASFRFSRTSSPTRSRSRQGEDRSP
jgi:signal transduction histidine kinase